MLHIISNAVEIKNNLEDHCFKQGIKQKLMLILFYILVMLKTVTFLSQLPYLIVVFLKDKPENLKPL